METQTGTQHERQCNVFECFNIVGAKEGGSFVTAHMWLMTMSQCTHVCERVCVCVCYAQHSVKYLLCSYTSEMVLWGKYCLQIIDCGCGLPAPLLPPPSLSSSCLFSLSVSDMKEKNTRTVRENCLFQLTHWYDGTGSGNIICYHFPSGNDTLGCPTPPTHIHNHFNHRLVFMKFGWFSFVFVWPLVCVFVCEDLWDGGMWD